MTTAAGRGARLRVLHIGSERQWRGGENQIRLLIEGSRAAVDHFIAYPASSEGYIRLSQLVPGYPLRRATPSSLADLVGLWRFCRRHSIDLIDAQSGNGHWLALELRLLGLPVAVVVHRRVDNPLKRSWNTRWKYRTDKVDRFVAISHCIERLLLDYGIEPQRITVVPSAVASEPYRLLARSVSRQQLLQRYGLAPDTLLIGNASAMTRQKGYDVLLDALALLAASGTRFHALLAGDGPLRRDLERQCDRLGLSDRVTFLGHIERVDELLSGLDVLAMPSNYEGLGTLLLEGCFAGCALAATNVGGIPEVVVAHETGLLSAVGDAAGLADNLAMLANDADMRARLSTAARARAERLFSVEAMVAGNLAVYEQVTRHLRDA